MPIKGHHHGTSPVLDVRCLPRSTQIMYQLQSHAAGLWSEGHRGDPRGRHFGAGCGALECEDQPIWLPSEAGGRLTPFSCGILEC